MGYSSDEQPFTPVPTRSYNTSETESIGTADESFCEASSDEEESNLTPTYFPQKQTQYDSESECSNISDSSDEIVEYTRRTRASKLVAETPPLSQSQSLSQTPSEEAEPVFMDENGTPINEGDLITYKTKGTTRTFLVMSFQEINRDGSRYLINTDYKTNFFEDLTTQQELLEQGFQHLDIDNLMNNKGMEQFRFAVDHENKIVGATVQNIYNK